jgi:hypothetical protein
MVHQLVARKGFAFESVGVKLLNSTSQWALYKLAVG